MASPVLMSKLGNSPWLWLAVFAWTATAGTFVIGPRYAHRQGQLQTRFEARQQVMQQTAQKNKQLAQQQADAKNDSKEKGVSNDNPPANVNPDSSAQAVVADTMTGKQADEFGSREAEVDSRNAEKKPTLTVLTLLLTAVALGATGVVVVQWKKWKQEEVDERQGCV